MSPGSIEIMPSASLNTPQMSYRDMDDLTMQTKPMDSPVGCGILLIWAAFYIGDKIITQ